MLYLILLFLMCSLYFYVESFKSALSARRWGAVGILLGPMAIPMFMMAQHVAMRKASGFNNLILEA